MSEVAPMVAREYQSEILRRVVRNTKNGFNSIIELDCGLGKRFLQYSFLFNEFKNERIILLLQASASLYETYEYLQRYGKKDEIALIDSRMPSTVRAYKLTHTRIIVSLPQTLHNTMKKNPSISKRIPILIINEVDQLIKRTGSVNYLKQPFSKLFEIFKETSIIGMSGTLRDEHYIQDSDQLKIKEELKTLCDLIGSVNFISMNDVMDTDLKDHLKTSFVIPTEVVDDNVAMISLELDQMIESAKNDILDEIKSFNVKLYNTIKKNPSLFFSPLPVDKKLHQRLFNGYLVRKFLWAMPFHRSRIHLLRYGMSKNYVFQTLQGEANKIDAAIQLAIDKRKSVILCSFLNTVEILEERLNRLGIKNIKVTGEINNSSRFEQLQAFREIDEPVVALISNVGERDLDLPEADILIIFDLVRTVKTVYQKLKRSRNGECRVLYYSETAEEKKVVSVLSKIYGRYSWSMKLMETQKINT